MEVAQVGHHPELEAKLFCAVCQARSQPVSYNYTDVMEGIEAGTYKISGQCIHCGGQLPPPVAPEPASLSELKQQAFERIAAVEEVQPATPPTRRPRVVREEP